MSEQEVARIKREARALAVQARRLYTGTIHPATETFGGSAEDADLLQVIEQLERLANR